MSPARHLDPRLFDETVAAVSLFAGPEHRLVYQNAACCRLLGARPLGLPAREAFPEPDAEEFLTVLDDVVATGRPRRLPDSREPDPGAAEQARYFVYSCTPVTMPEGHGAMVVALDTTAETLALQRYEALVSAVSQMVGVLRPDGSAEEIVPGWQRLTGVPWHGRMDEEWAACIHPRDRERLMCSWGTAIAAEPPGVFENTYRVRTADGSYRHMSTRCVPVLRGGRAEEWVTATIDVEDTWRATLGERLLAQVAEVSGERLEDTFAAVVRVIVPELADACVILLLAQEAWPLPETATVTARRIASATRPGLPARPALRGQSVTVSGTVREVLESRAPRTIPLPAGGRVPSGLVPEVTEQWLADADATSLTLIPLVVDSTVLGYAATSTNGDTPAPAPADIELLRSLLHLAHQPIRRVLDLQQARSTALRLQHAHLTEPPAVPGAVLAACYRPASPAHEIGGDWYDAITHPDGTLVLDIGDVAGHDLTAATAMGQLRSMLRGLAWNRGPDCTPATLLTMLDDAAEGLNIASFTTVVHTHLRRRPDGTWRMAWSNAGHPPPLLVPARGEPRFLTGTDQDPPLCVAPGVRRATHTHVLGPGDTLLHYTDGLVETPTASFDVGQRRLLRAAASHRAEPLPDLLRLLQDLSDDRDDTALIAFRAHPAD
ncbi:SpoIIE family protein phosphatase [Streptomyces sp. SID5910]|uniref:SpoIIE family protein phosphatase n=1 Tax=Streptomyces sp. SID5910 TaxID=2690312 RepID=UPI0013701B80|nr:SpoIIE family protein phosphatase [Streptomyces sp. SID5910]MYR41406.1 SpoIIE family protein phosphatase [Streptomyces sp. SID5910]